MLRMRFSATCSMECLHGRNSGVRSAMQDWEFEVSFDVGKIEAKGERLKESQFISKPLSVLRDLVAALASKAAHVPHRTAPKVGFLGINLSLLLIKEINLSLLLHPKIEAKGERLKESQFISKPLSVLMVFLGLSKRSTKLDLFKGNPLKLIFFLQQFLMQSVMSLGVPMDHFLQTLHKIWLEAEGSLANREDAQS